MGWALAKAKLSPSGSASPAHRLVGCLDPARQMA